LRTSLEKEKTGVYLGVDAINPINGQVIPVYVADYVLGSYGSGAVMAVPCHDERDYAFAKKHDIPMIQVLEGDVSNRDDEGDGKHINSDFANGLISLGPKPRSRRNSSNSTRASASSITNSAIGFSRVNVIGASRSQSSI
jgi:leucyl-tRNA synthetase